MEDIILVFPTDEYREQYLDLWSEYIKYNEKPMPFSVGLGDGNFYEFLRLIKNHANGIELPDWMVPNTTHFLVRENDKEILGTVNIRHCLNDSLRDIGGHIGYGIRPSERGKGYGKKMLALAL